VFGKIDLSGAVVSPFFVLASGVSVGLFDLTLFGLDFADPLFTLGSGTTLGSSFEAQVAILAIDIAYLTKEPRLDNLGLVETWTVAITVLHPHSAGLPDRLTGSNTLSWILSVALRMVDRTERLQYAAGLVLMGGAAVGTGAALLSFETISPAYFAAAFAAGAAALPETEQSWCRVRERLPV